MFKNKVNLKKVMPLLTRQEGKWVGSYLHLNASGGTIDEHNSLVECKLSSDPANAYVQTSTYTWADGKTETLVLPAQWNKGELIWKNGPYSGKIWQADDATLVSHWHRSDSPGSYLYEVLHMSRNGQQRSRSWTWFQTDKIHRRTLIQESKKR